MNWLLRLIRERLSIDDRGVTTSEYAIMLVLVALAVAAFGPGLNNAVTGVFQDLMDILTP